MNGVDMKNKNETLYIHMGKSKISFASYEYAMNKDEIKFDDEPYTINRAASIVVNLRDAFNRIRLMTPNVKKAVVLVDSPITFVPLADFQEEEAKTLYEFNFVHTQKIEVFYDVLSYFNISLLFGLESSIVRVFEETFQEVYFLSAYTPILKQIAVKSSTQKTIYAFLQEEQLDLFVVQNNKILGTNRFEMHAGSDAVYYIMGFVKQCKLDVSKDRIFLNGESFEIDEVEKQLKEFVKNVSQDNYAVEFSDHPVAMHPHLPYSLATYLVNLHS